MNQINLPHLPPLLFAKDIIKLSSQEATVLCEFDCIPSLSMFIEASAQSSSVFESNLSKAPKIGFLTKTKEIKLLEKIEEKSYFANLKKELEIGNIKQFSFEIVSIKNNAKIAIGEFTILVQE